MPYKRVVVALGMLDRRAAAIAATAKAFTSEAEMSGVHVVESASLNFGVDLAVPAIPDYRELVLEESGWRLILGSTANAVLHGTPCELLCVRVWQKVALYREVLAAWIYRRTPAPCCAGRWRSPAQAMRGFPLFPLSVSQSMPTWVWTCKPKAEPL